MCTLENSLSFLEKELTTLRQIRSLYPNRCQHPEIVSVIAPTNKILYMENIFNNYQRQNYQNKELIIVLNKDQLVFREWSAYGKNYPNVRILQVDEATTLGECLNLAVSIADGNYICKFDDDDYYGPDFITDLIAGFTVSDAALLGKTSHFVYFEGTKKLYILNHGSAYKNAKSTPGGAHIVKREVFAKVAYPSLDLGEDGAFINQCITNGFKLFAVDPFNYAAFRSCNLYAHTWKIAEEQYTPRLKLVAAEVDDFTPLVTA